MKHRTALVASIASIAALALVAVLVIPGFTAESRGAAPHDQLNADGDMPACHPADMASDMAKGEGCNMANMPEDCQEMMADGCMGSDGMMSMHRGMMSMHPNAKGMHGMMMNCMSGMGEAGSEAARDMHEDADGMAACPMTSRTDTAAETPEKTVQ